MIYLKSNAIGLDKAINSIASHLNTRLNTQKSWALDIYHKVYKEPKDGKYYPYVFVSEKDYTPIFVTDKSNGNVGFVVSENREVNGTNFVVDVDVIFSVNLDKLDSSSTQREDEKILAICQNALVDYEITGIKTGLKNVYQGFDTESISYRDMQPYFNFSFTVKVTYKNVCI